MKPASATSAQSAVVEHGWVQYASSGPGLLRAHVAPFWLSELAHLLSGAQSSPSSVVSEYAHLWPGPTAPRVRVVGLHGVTSAAQFEAAASVGHEYDWAELPLPMEQVKLPPPDELELLELPPPHAVTTMVMARAATDSERDERDQTVFDMRLQKLKDGTRKRAPTV